MRKSSKSNNDQEEQHNEEDLHLKPSKLNVSAGRVIYEKARSRRERHRLALMSSDHSSDAMPLGKSGRRGPGRTTDMPRDKRNEQFLGHGDGEEESAKKVHELIRHGHSAIASMSSSMSSSSSRFRSTISRGLVTKQSVANTRKKQANSTSTSQQLFHRKRKLDSAKPPSGLGEGKIYKIDTSSRIPKKKRNKNDTTPTSNISSTSNTSNSSKTSSTSKKKMKITSDLIRKKTNMSCY